MIDNHMFAHIGDMGLSRHSVSYLGEGAASGDVSTLDTSVTYPLPETPQSSYPSYPPVNVDMTVPDVTSGKEPE